MPIGAFVTPSLTYSHLLCAATFPTQIALCVTSICISTCVRPLAGRRTTHSPTSSLVPLWHRRRKVGRGLLLPRSWGDGHHPPSRCRRSRRLQILAGNSFSRPVWSVPSGKRTSDIARRSNASGMSASGRSLGAPGVDGSRRKCPGTVLRHRQPTLLHPHPYRVASGHWPCEAALGHSHRMPRLHLRGGPHLLSPQNLIVGDLRCPPLACSSWTKTHTWNMLYF